MTELEKFDQLDKDVDNTVRNSDSRRAALKARGKYKMELGLSTAVRDLLRAHSILLNEDEIVQQRSDAKNAAQDLRLLADNYARGLERSNADYKEHALIGEAMRVLVRDTLLSRTNSADEAEFWLELSATAFDVAIAKMGEMGKKDVPLDHSAWILAHAGASSATLFWLRQATKRPNAGAAFEKASMNLQKSIDVLPKDWAHRFLGLLFAIRAGAGDLKKAEAQLDAVKADKGPEQSSLQSAKALLLGYTALDLNNAKISVEERVAAARRSISEGFAAGQTDTEDHKAAYAVTMSAYSLYLLALTDSKKTDAERARLKGQVALTREEAWTRVHNVFSQTCAELASLTLMNAELGGASAAEAEERAFNYLTCVSRDGSIGLEATLLFARDPFLKQLREKIDPTSTDGQTLSNIASLC
jgi:hypothetical protein